MTVSFANKDTMFENYSCGTWSYHIHNTNVRLFTVRLTQNDLSTHKDMEKFIIDNRKISIKVPVQLHDSISFEWNKE